MPPQILRSLPSLLSRCVIVDKPIAGAALHAHAIKFGANSDPFLANSIVNLYAKCCSPREASLAFDDIHGPDVGSWNCLINSFSHQGPGNALKVLHIFQRMRAEAPSVRPNSFTLTGVFTALSHLPDRLSYGTGVHAVALKTLDHIDMFVESSIVSMYCKLGFSGEARKVFDRMSVRSPVSWATMISGYADERCGFEAFELFKLMLVGGDCNVNEFVLTSVLSAVSSPEFAELGGQVHCHAVKDGLLSFTPVINALVTTNAKCGWLDEALKLFEFSSAKNEVTWSAVVTGFAQNGSFCKALSLFYEMHFNGVMPSEYTFVGVLNACSDSAAFNEGKQAHAYLLKLGFESQLYIKSALIDMYAKSSSISDAQKVFDQILEPDIVLWTAMISGYVKNGDHEASLSLYARMAMTGFPPNDLTLGSILRACSGLAVLQLGKQIHAHTIKYGFSLKAPVGSALSNMYAKCGDLGESYIVFKSMPARDVVAWNSIISGYAQNGFGPDALSLFEDMKKEGIRPNDVTFVNLLSACSHMGLVERGWFYFRSMNDEYDLAPNIEHYACMVDILSRAGLLDEAKTFIESIPIDHGTCLWRILLGACVNYRRFDVGACAGERLLELGTQDSSAYILLSNVYAASGRRDEIERVRRIMNFQRVKKKPGCSWVEVNNRVHTFLVRDQLHPENVKIYREVQKLDKFMKDESHQPSIKSHLHGFVDTYNMSFQEILLHEISQ